MIPYQELCDALAKWRSRNGKANGPSARPQAPAINPITVVSAPPDLAGMTPPQGEPAIGEEPLLLDQPTRVTPAPLPPAPASPVPPPVAAGEDSFDAPTGLHLVEDKEGTGEIDCDSNLIDEDQL